MILDDAGREILEMADVHALSTMEIVDPRHHATSDLAVRRALGGTSLIWCGRCVPYDDFERREHVAECLRIHLKCTAVDFRFADEGRRLQGVVVASDNDRRLVTAHRYVLAGGGIECARLLLHAQTTWPRKFVASMGLWVASIRDMSSAGSPTSCSPTEPSVAPSTIFRTRKVSTRAAG